LLLLASLVHHSAWIKSICSQYPDHPFHSIPLLNEPKLIQELLDEHLTLERSDLVPIATGVPPSVKHSKLIKKVLEVCERTDAKVDTFMEHLNESVADAVDAKVAAEGGVNSSILKSTIQDLKDEILGKISVTYGLV
jgi:ABC-type methionine transport system ATPase subunit